MYGTVARAYIPLWISFEEEVVKYQADVLIEYMMRDVVSPILNGRLSDWEDM